MEKAHGLRQPSPPMKPGDRKARNRAAVSPRGAFSAQMLRPPRTPTFSMDSPLPEEEDGEFSYDYAFVTSRRTSISENQALSPPPPPPPLPSSRGFHRPMLPRSTAPTPRSPSVKSLANGRALVKPAAAVKSKNLTQSPTANNGPTSNQSPEMPTPSVHPIDTLSKKLRQQAMELTHVYEELEKQNLQIDAYKQQVQEQKRELEQLRVQRRKSVESSSRVPRVGVLEQQKRAAQLMIGTSSSGASLGQKRGQLDRKLKEAELEKKKYEVAAKRIENALVELQVFQNDRMEKLLPTESSSNQAEDDLEAILNEQRAYIRVLEEAVHLKATDFEVTGHEELLVVLAELRHTIYEQEKDVEQKNSQLLSSQEQLEQEITRHVATKDLLLAAQRQQEDMAKQFHEQEAALHDQIHEARRQLQQLQGVSNDAQRTGEALHNRLTAATKSQNLSEAQLEDAKRTIQKLQQQLEELSTKYEKAALQTVTLQQECTKKQSHLDELNALQEELLGSVDKYVGKVKKARDKVERLESELQSLKEKELLVQHKLEDTTRASGEQIAALQARLDATEHCEQLFKEQITALEQEKSRLVNTLAEVEQSLQDQAQESNEQQQEIAKRDQKCRHVEEAVAELEAALATALLMMLEKRSKDSELQGTTDDESDSDEHSFLLDKFVLSELRVCCQALGTLTASKAPAQCTTLCPSFPGIVARVATIGGKVLEEVTRALASWSSERTNLVEACATLDSTARMCQEEMEKRHEELGDYRQQLSERTSEVEAFAMQVDALDEQLRRAEAEYEAYRALKQHSADQETALEAKQALIDELSTENDRLAAVENAYSVQLATNQRYAERLEDQLKAMKEQQIDADELEHALENAAIFAEQQNECNHQLNSQLGEAENTTREQAERIKTLNVQLSAFSSRFMAFVKQYTTVLRPTAATNRGLQDHLSLFDAEIQNGDVLRLLQLFPALLEEYVTACTNNDEPIDSRDCYWRSKTTACPVKRKAKAVGWSSEIRRGDHGETSALSPAAAHEAPSTKQSLPLEVGITKRSQFTAATQKEEAQLAEQLELIRGAFQSYKEDTETQR